MDLLARRLSHFSSFHRRLSTGEEKVAAIIRGLGELRGATCEAVDVARAAVYLASEDSKYVSGHNLVVDGGFTSYKNMNLPFPTKAHN